MLLFDLGCQHSEVLDNPAQRDSAAGIRILINIFLYAAAKIGILINRI